MKTYYQTNKGFKSSEEDVYGEGCIPNSGINCIVDISFNGNSTDDIINQIKNYFDVDDDYLLLDSCEENGRIDIQLHENENGDKASDNEIKQWINGKLSLWLCTYTYRILKITEEEVILTK